MAFQFVLLLICLVAAASAAPSNKGDDPQTVIVGGRDASRGEFPHQVSLQSNSRHFCGGSIISESWILTAAHCIVTNNIVVKAGKHNVNSLQEYTEQSSRVARSIVHPSYAGEVGPYDIALLRLSTPLKFNQYVQAIKLPAANSQHTGSAILSGWGSVSRTTQPQMPSILQTVTLSLMNANTCKATFSMLNPYSGSKVHSTNVCTSAGNAGLSACSGDSGGPLISTSNGAKEVIGVVSWGMIPCGGQSPSVYTKVSSFINWIQTNMNSY